MEDSDTDGDNHSDGDSDKFGNGIVYAMKKRKGQTSIGVCPHVLLLALLPSKEEAVVAHKLTHQQETINGGNAVGDEAGYHLALASGLLRGCQFTPDSGYLT